jgi:hypothetical protein
MAVLGPITDHLRRRPASRGRWSSDMAISAAVVRAHQ